MRVAILVPVLGRPHRVAPLADDVAAATPEDHRLVFIASEGDTDTIAELEGRDHLVVDHPGTYARKINAGFRATTEPVLVMAADDVHFHPGWLPAALARLTDGVQVVGINDLGNPRVLRGEHACHNLFTRSYIDERSGVADQPGLVLHEGYGHAYCDDEFVGTARHRGVWAFAPDSVIEHMHPLFGKAEMDDTYLLGRQHNRDGLRLHQKRRHLWT